MDILIDIVIRSILTFIVYGLANYHTYTIGTTLHYDSKPLPDIVHDILPDYSRYVNIRDYILLFFFVPIVFVKKRIEFFFNFWNIFLVIVTLKAITIFFTFLPSSNPQCHTHRYLNHCYHQMFSGHNSVVVLLYLLYLKYLPLNGYELIAFLPVVFYSLIILMTRCHYSVDILVSYIIVYLLVV